MKTALIFILFMILIIIGLYAFYGGFKKIRFQIVEQGGELLIYENMTGDYKNSATVMDKIYASLLENEQIETYKGCGIYYDNPRYVEKDKLRSEIGCILETKDSKMFDSLKANYKTKSIPKAKYLTTRFPYKGKFSVLIGILRVYPALTKYLKTHGFNENGYMIEIYDAPNHHIVYRKEIIKP